MKYLSFPGEMTAPNLKGRGLEASLAPLLKDVTQSVRLRSVYYHSSCEPPHRPQAVSWRYSGTLGIQKVWPSTTTLFRPCLGRSLSFNPKKVKCGKSLSTV